MEALWITLGVIGGIITVALLYLLFLFVASLFVNGKTEYTKNSKFYRALLNTTTAIALFLVGVKVHVKGEEMLQGQPRFLLVGNHRSNYDPIVTWYKLRKYDLSFISKPENFSVPIFGKLVRKCCFRKIDRKSPRNAILDMRSSASLIASGEVSMGVYPEGTRSKAKEMLPFHDGVLKIAQFAKCPIIVTAVRGTEKVHKNYPWKRSHVYIDIIKVYDEETVMATPSKDLGALIKQDLTTFLDENDK